MPMNIQPKKIVSMIIASKGKPSSESQEMKSSDEPENDVSLAGRDAAKRFMDAVKGEDANACWKAYLALHEVADEMLESEEEESEESPETESEEKSKGMEY